MKSQEIEGITKTDYEHLNVFIPLQVPKLYKALGEPFSSEIYVIAKTRKGINWANLDEHILKKYL